MHAELSVDLAGQYETLNGCCSVAMGIGISGITAQSLNHCQHKMMPT